MVDTSSSSSAFYQHFYRFKHTCSTAPTTWNQNELISGQAASNQSILEDMDFQLSHRDKLLIISIACTLILVTLVLTVCLVSPWCYLYKCLSRSRIKRKSKINYPSLHPAESKHFHLSIVPVYGSSSNGNGNVGKCSNGPLFSPQSSLNNNNNGAINQFEHLTELAEKARRKYSFNKNKNNNSNNNGNNTIDDVRNNNKLQPVGQPLPRSMEMNCPKIEMVIYYKLINDCIIRIYIQIKRIYDLKIKELSTSPTIVQEPSPYVVVLISGYQRSYRKNIPIKGVQNELFRTETVKKSWDVQFPPCQAFVSEELPKNLLKDAYIRFKLMNEERYANDFCLAELNVSLKKIKSYDDLVKNPEHVQQPKDDADDDGSKTIPLNDNDRVDDGVPKNDEHDDIESNLVQFKATTYQMLPIKEIKGELLAGFCYLPTSRRVNITIIKGNIQNSSLRIIINNNNNSSTTNHQAYYIKALMFNNGKLIKKKKTSLSIRMAWSKNETISFDLPNDGDEQPPGSTMANDQISFMLVLAYKTQDSQSPESPESPDNSINSMAAALKNGDQNGAQQPTTTTSTTLNCGKMSIVAKNSTSNNNNMRKETYIGHFILDRTTWIEDVLKKPRKQIIKWYKLY